MSELRDDITGSDQLNAKQLEAINLLSTGMTKVAVADTVGVHRVTLSGWHKDPRFRAELNRRIRERAEASAVRMQNLVEASLDVMEEAIRRDRDPKAAGQFLRLVGAHGFLGAPVVEPATFEEAALQIALEEEHRSRALSLVVAAGNPPTPTERVVEYLAGAPEAGKSPPAKPDKSQPAQPGSAEKT
ncbi:MAG: hypothetical protein M3Q23_03590 [Actinomycetota bacterium]|nr:hypothetical protein [Actinomycetota bacterium]